MDHRAFRYRIEELSGKKRNDVHDERDQFKRDIVSRNKTIFIFVLEIIRYQSWLVRNEKLRNVRRRKEE